MVDQATEPPHRASVQGELHHEEGVCGRTRLPSRDYIHLHLDSTREHTPTHAHRALVLHFEGVLAYDRVGELVDLKCEGSECGL